MKRTPAEYLDELLEHLTFCQAGRSALFHGMSVYFDEEEEARIYATILAAPGLRCFASPGWNGHDGLALEVVTDDDVVVNHGVDFQGPWSGDLDDDTELWRLLVTAALLASQGALLVPAGAIGPKLTRIVRDDR